MYMNNFTSKENVAQEFSIGIEELDGCDILLATYGYEDYSGSAFVLFEKDGQLYEVNGGHCSCMGLEGQWEPEETDVIVLYYRITKGTLGQSYEGDFDTELKQVLANRYGVTF